MCPDLGGDAALNPEQAQPRGEQERDNSPVLPEKWALPFPGFPDIPPRWSMGAGQVGICKEYFTLLFHLSAQIEPKSLSPPLITAFQENFPVNTHSHLLALSPPQPELIQRITEELYLLIKNNDFINWQMC